MILLKSLSISLATLFFITDANSGDGRDIDLESKLRAGTSTRPTRTEDNPQLERLQFDANELQRQAAIAAERERKKQAQAAATAKKKPGKKR